MVGHARKSKTTGSNRLSAVTTQITSHTKMEAVPASRCPLRRSIRRRALTVDTATPTLSWAAQQFPFGGGYSYLSLFDITSGLDALSGFYTPTGPGPSTYTHAIRWTTTILMNGRSRMVVSPAARQSPSQYRCQEAAGRLLSRAVLNPVSADGVVTTGSPQFSWQAVPGATSYGFRLMSKGSDIIPPALVQGTSYTVEIPSDLLVEPTVLTWSVTAYDFNDDYSPPSQPSSFLLSAPQGNLLPGPTGLSPQGTVTTASPTFQWTPDSDQTEYGWDLVDGTTGVLVTSQNVANPSFTYNLTSQPALIDGHVYRWYVYDWDPSNLEAVSLVSAQTFTDSEPLGTPRQMAPVSLSIASSLTPEFQWSPVSGAVGYNLSVIDPTGRL